MLSGCNQKQDEENKLNVDFGVCQERDWGLLTRCKGSKLNYSQIMYLWNKISRLDTPASELSKQYMIAPSTLYRIQKLSKKEAITTKKTLSMHDNKWRKESRKNY